ncbi:PREDICTED: nucleolar protein 8-like [Dinoponera quadriceps]|uniref:Nucleolar protein 8-like n=1 Tax=Dinoponera quadriceps TaxID=609295 RepID=A0A6P3XCT7_DINQU|nr:PREDICTED: nucleolar protein 8-like [Dinoponera quadriceps]XP_014476140.1 PREDICTED: nucleolar protein 8-like [Dinoponera quadriceps]
MLSTMPYSRSHDGTGNKRIIFDDDFGKHTHQDPKTKREEKVNLFEDDDHNEDVDDNENLWNEDTFNTKKRKKIILGHDARFTLDGRFAEDNHQDETEVITGAEECDLQKEKERELDILKDVLGMPFSMKNQEAKASKKELMIRYDPAEKRHCEYEVKTVQSETKERSAKQKKREKAKIEESTAAEVPKDVYYTVSDTLTRSLKQNERFSLLKACGREENDMNIDDRDTRNCDIANSGVSTMRNDKDVRFHFSARNAFKHDLSDNEDLNERFDERVVEQSENDNRINDLFEYGNILFFRNDDVRFNEAVRFFDVKVTSSEEFKNLRRKLKVIIRTKIRRNERKYQPWNKKKKIKRS